MVPSGERLQFANWKITMFIFRKSPKKWAMFNSKLLVDERVNTPTIKNHPSFASSLASRTAAAHGAVARRVAAPDPPFC